MNKELTKFKETEIGPIPEEWGDGDLFLGVVLGFLTKESFILLNNLNERTITSKLAEYIGRGLSERHVDCEYNRMHGGVEDVEYISKTLNLKAEEVKSDSIDGPTVFPDIIVHERGNNDNNYIVIEVKKKEFAEKIRRDGETYKDFDKSKLRAYTKELKYERGIYLEFDKDKVSEINFFQNGEEYK